MEKMLFVLFGLYLIYLVAEAFLAARYRHAIQHVIYINGTRGKSSVTRLIDAGLKAGEWRSFAKTTGTLPMIIDTKGNEKLIHRRGRANIKEQIQILGQAYRENAQVLVIECMAVNPELQYISQHRMVKSDIGVITNVRPDHLDVMGNTLDQIGDSLCNTIPKEGICFTGDKEFFPRFSKRCNNLKTMPVLVLADGTEPDFDFPENIALALAVCESLGVDKEIALNGMKNYKPDPYALSMYRLKNSAIVLGGLSINDPISMEMVYDRITNLHNLKDYKLTLLISNRLDRGYRTLQHQELAVKLNPKTVWIIGANSGPMSHFLKRKLPDCHVMVLRNAGQAPLDNLGSNDLVFAIGNIGEGGNAFMDRVKKEGLPYV